MELVKQCNDPFIVLLIILLALSVRFAFQKINVFVISTPYKKKIRHTLHSLNILSILRGETTFKEAEKKP
jgi:hypothetical protein